MSLLDPSVFVGAIDPAREVARVVDVEADVLECISELPEGEARRGRLGAKGVSKLIMKELKGPT